jgi:hypothetical protein
MPPLGAHGGSASSQELGDLAVVAWSEHGLDHLFAPSAEPLPTGEASALRIAVQRLPVQPRPGIFPGA